MPITCPRACAGNQYVRYKIAPGKNPASAAPSKSRAIQKDRSLFANTIAAATRPRTRTELAQALGAFARDATGPQRTLTLTRYALLVEAAQYPALRPQLALGGARVNLYFENWLLRVGSTNPDRDLRIVANFLTGRILHDLAVPDPAFDPTSDLVELLEALVAATPAPH